MAFLWTFLRVFAPAAVKGSLNEDGPAYQLGLRKSLSVLFWNDTLIYGSIIFLSARTICLPFLLDSSKTVLASTVFRRGIRLWFPVATAMIIVYFSFTQTILTRLLDFATLTGNTSLDTDLYLLPNSLANFNAIFMTFWTTHNFQLQAASFAFPSQMLWVISAVFQQSYTVYMAMVTIPYTRPRWRVFGAIAFVLTAWWVYSWAWYSISGLLVADAVMNMGLTPGGSASCITISKVRIPVWIIGSIFMSAGFIMQFVWTAARPDLQNAELMYHTGIYNTGGLNTSVDVKDNQIRADCYLIVLGFSLILETSSVLQSIFRNKFLVLLGRRSLSTFDPYPKNKNKNRKREHSLTQLRRLLPHPIHHHLHTRRQNRHRQERWRETGPLPSSSGCVFHRYSDRHDISGRSAVLARRDSVEVVRQMAVRLDQGVRCELGRRKPAPFGLCTALLRILFYTHAYCWAFPSHISFNR